MLFTSCFSWHEQILQDWKTILAKKSKKFIKNGLLIKLSISRINYGNFNYNPCWLKCLFAFGVDPDGRYVVTISQ